MISLFRKTDPAIGYSLTPEQQVQFNTFFSQVQEKYLGLPGMEYLVYQSFVAAGELRVGVRLWT